MNISDHTRRELCRPCAVVGQTVGSSLHGSPGLVVGEYEVFIGVEPTNSVTVVPKVTKCLQSSFSRNDLAMLADFGGRRLY